MMNSNKILILALLLGLFCITEVSAIVNCELGNCEGYYFEVNMSADKVTYPAGSEIQYKFWRDVSCPYPYNCFVDHCYGYPAGEFIIDSHIEKISTNMPYYEEGFPYCKVNSKTVFCFDEGSTMLWAGETGWLPDREYNNDFTITGKIKDDTPAGTILKSTANIDGCPIESWTYIGWGSSSSESQVIVTEHPKIFTVELTGPQEVIQANNVIYTVNVINFVGNIDHLDSFEFNIDPNIGNIRDAPFGNGDLFKPGGGCQLNDHKIICDTSIPDKYSGELMVNGKPLKIYGNVNRNTQSGNYLTSSISFTGVVDPTDTYPVSDSNKTLVLTNVSVPEFPSVFLPATMIIGLLGAIFLIKRSREQ